MTRILIVDDDPILLRVYQSKLTSEGFTVEAVGDGAAALMAIAAKAPDLLLLDLMLPGMSGVEVIRTVRGRERGRRLPIVVLSNLYLEEESAAATSAGADVVLAKSGTTPRKVVEAIRGLLSVLAPRDIHPLTIAPPMPEPLPPMPTAAAAPATPRSASPAAADAPASAVPLPPLAPNPAIVRGAAALDIVPSKRPGSESFLRSEAFIPQIEPMLDEAKRCLAALRKDPTALPTLGRTCKHIGNRALAAQRWDVAKLAAAGESLVYQIGQPSRLTPSTVRTLTQVVERFRVLAAARTSGTDLDAIATLVLDDEGVSRTTMGLALGKVGLQGTPMADPRQALDMLTRTRFHLILSDVMMNGMSGFQFATAARALPGYAHTPIIFVTALADFESRPTHGADDLIGKPFMLMELGTKALLHVLTGDGDLWAGR